MAEILQYSYAGITQCYISSSYNSTKAEVLYIKHFHQHTCHQSQCENHNWLCNQIRQSALSGHNAWPSYTSLILYRTVTSLILTSVYESCKDTQNFRLQTKAGPDSGKHICIIQVIFSILYVYCSSGVYFFSHTLCTMHHYQDFQGDWQKSLWLYNFFQLT